MKLLRLAARGSRHSMCRGESVMRTSDRAWSDQLAKRFAERPEIPLEEVFKRDFQHQGVARADFHSCCELLVDELAIPVAKLLPLDDLSFVLNSPKPRTPWQWLVFQTREGDSMSEIEHQLDLRMKRAGTRDHWNQISTFRDLVRAWSGLLPFESASPKAD